MKTIQIFILFLLSSYGYSQTTNTFEDFILPAAGFLNGQDVAGEYIDKTVSLPNSYEEFPNFIAWSGWAISSVTDNITPGASNQYSVISGSGYDNSLNYAITYVSNMSQIKLLGEATGKPVRGFYVNNSTYAYFSMLEGDAYAKRFGGESGDDPDYFLLTIKKYYQGELSSDSINFYLADYRFDDNNLDYIVNNWEFVDLSNFGNVDSLALTLSSSDNGTFGMNTPAYFCIDNFITKDLQTSIGFLNSDLRIKTYPNPSVSTLNIDLPLNLPSQINIYNALGLLKTHQSFNSKIISFDVSQYPIGQYFITIVQDKTLYNSSFTKK